ncbi:MAG: cytochrome c maturation protein CcmE [Clostridia bacterium]|nr:cytochrome c maturation protein CcmE [Clostridia bacterium]
MKTNEEATRELLCRRDERKKSRGVTLKRTFIVACLVSVTVCAALFAVGLRRDKAGAPTPDTSRTTETSQNLEEGSVQEADKYSFTVDDLSKILTGGAAYDGGMNTKDIAIVPDIFDRKIDIVVEGTVTSTHSEYGDDAAFDRNDGRFFFGTVTNSFGLEVERVLYGDESVAGSEITVTDTPFRLFVCSEELYHPAVEGVKYVLFLTKTDTGYENGSYEWKTVAVDDGYAVWKWEGDRGLAYGGNGFLFDGLDVKDEWVASRLRYVDKVQFEKNVKNILDKLSNG